MSEYQAGVKWYNDVLIRAQSQVKEIRSVPAVLISAIVNLRKRTNPGYNDRNLTVEDGKQIAALAQKILDGKAKPREGRSEGLHNPFKTIGLVARTPEDYFKQQHKIVWEEGLRLAASSVSATASAPASVRASAASAPFVSAAAVSAPVRAPALVASASARPPVAGMRLPASAPVASAAASAAPARVSDSSTSTSSTTMSSPLSSRGRSDSSSTGRSRSDSESSSDSVDSSYSVESTDRKLKLAEAKAAASMKRSKALEKIKGDAKAIAAGIKSVTEQYKLDRAAAKEKFGRVHKSVRRKPLSLPAASGAKPKGTGRGSG